MKDLSMMEYVKTPSETPTGLRTLQQARSARPHHFGLSRHAGGDARALTKHFPFSE